MAETKAPTQEEQDEQLAATKAKAKAKREANAAAKEIADAEAEAAAAVVAEEAVVEAAEEPQKLRRRGRGTGRALLKSTVPYPKGIHGEDYEDYGPGGPAAVIPEGVEVADYSEDQEFILDMTKLDTFSFAQPGRNLPKRARLYNIKGIHRDGRIIQVPFEGQIENTAGGDPGDAIGLRRNQRKGITILIDWDTLMPLYCAAFECWAQASAPDENDHLQPLIPAFPGFCSGKHAVWTMPNKFKDSGEIMQAMFGDRATTSRIWGN